MLPAISEMQGIEGLPTNIRPRRAHGPYVCVRREESAARRAAKGL